MSLNEVRRIPDASVVKGLLTQHAIPKSYTFNLLKDESKKQSIKPVTHLKSKYFIIMCTEELNVPDTNVPMEIMRLLRINSKRQIMPMIIQDFLQSRLRDLQEITPSMTSTNFTFGYNPYSVGKLKFLIQMESTFTHFLQFGFTEKDVDEVKGVFADTNLYLLCATVFIGSVHVSIKL